MDITIGSLKVGTPVVLGNYGVCAENPCPIVWLKGSPNCDFISERALDILCFDTVERNNEGNNARWAGNPDYETSNLYQFLNSEAWNWYTPAHEYDAPPSADVYGNRCAYHQHPGFLYFFEEYELDSLQAQAYHVGELVATSLIKLPSINDIIGTGRLKLFFKKGVRPKGTGDLITRKGNSQGIDENSYIPFWLAESSGIYSSIINRSGNYCSQLSSSLAGIRPMCSIKPDAIVELGDDGIYRIKPYTITRETFTDEEFFEYLGITHL